ncbi:MAG: hypothetical protein NZP74_01390 [Anaerolineales bacterium]|nr:hypothetical protein [Anaerolineales bacterium]MDW8278000.1 hypothetical protein [Anaerolineales bacterium]
MKTRLQTLFLAFTLFALVLLALPAQSALAAGHDDPPTPAATPDPERAKIRLEWAFANLKLAVQRIGLNLEYQDEFLARVEDLIAKAKEQGKDVAAAEKALADYKQALAQAKPFYEQAVSLVQTHEGFDASGKVTDLEKARETVRALGEAVKQYRETLREPLRALREALKALRPETPRRNRP